jgi:hypothetical protein
MINPGKSTRSVCRIDIPACPSFSLKLSAEQLSLPVTALKNGQTGMSVLLTRVTLMPSCPSPMRSGHTLVVCPERRHLAARGWGFGRSRIQLDCD